MSARTPLALALAGLLVLGVANDAEAARGFDVRDLHKLDRVSSPVLSPDGARVVFAKREIGEDLGKASTGLWIRDLRTRDLAPPRRLTPEGWSVNSPAFSADGQSVYFLSAKDGTQQLYSIPVTGGQPRQLTRYPLDIGSYKVSPDGKRIAVSMDVFPDCGANLDCTVSRLDERGKSKTSGVLYDQLFVRHWDTWADGRHSRLFVTTPANGDKAPAPVLVGAAKNDPVGHVPSRPFGGSDEYTWSPDGKSLVFSMRVADRQEPWSTNFDLYLYRDGQPLKNLTASNPAWDTGPVFSADGKTLYYRAMKRPGFEADRFGLMAMDLASGKVREIAPRWDRSADGIVLSADGKTIYTTAQHLGQHPLFAVDVASGKVEQVVGEGSISAFDIAGDTLAFTRNSLKSGDQLFTAALSSPAAQRAITPSAGEMLPEVAFGEYEQFTFAGWNNETVHGYVVKPWNYEEGKRYPVAFLIHGGPQGSFGDGWSYRWNPQTYAGQGYAVVMIDFHGSTGYGQAFTDSISGDWGGKPLEDLQKGWAAAQQKYPFLDGDRACALGASYGGYMINWIAGNWFESDGSSPWKCLVNHDGVFDTRAMGYVTEELWFTEWENGGTPYDKPENFEKFNPVNHVAKWRVPMLVVQGEKDYRVPVDQGLSAFTALQRKGIESQLLYFPDENHWVLKPANSVLWHDTVNAWLKKHIGQ
ncbi:MULTISPECIES: alpha/beta hydrolase family protein [Pseudoxanthomonas]|uniref:Dipeptidyl aminopeptidase/acylaminoacyl peptidase n=1 Tax=Pseudoxanthomonas taiwanensis J19 TaxID=935569 RepID=A0A562D826_9GAMM|nr:MULTISPECIES: S9 family peptidase [Pseudoxanthomonas]TWH05876.1 dipeptidyl aminopeptidase/acylaminoacyl peptidase [Pseudoxanthomonas taiwanensis J19]